MKALIAVLCLVSSAALAGAESGNGGGGIKKDGKYMTFGSAKVEIQPKQLKDIEGLLKLISVIRETRILEYRYRASMLEAVYPRGKRQYYAIKESDLTNEYKEQLKKLYHDNLGGSVPMDDLVIFAITNTEDGITYLFPEFFKLKVPEQTAVLYHESLWLLNPKLTYKQVIDSEIKFQNYIEYSGVNRFETEFFRTLNAVFSSRFIALRSAHMDDSLRNDDAFCPITQCESLDDSNCSNGRPISLESLIGPKALQKKASYDDRDTRRSHYLVPNSYVKYHLSQTIEQHPSCFVLQELYELVDLIDIESYYDRKYQVPFAGDQVWILDSIGDSGFTHAGYCGTTGTCVGGPEAAIFQRGR